MSTRGSVAILLFMFLLRLDGFRQVLWCGLKQHLLNVPKTLSSSSTSSSTSVSTTTRLQAQERVNIIVSCPLAAAYAYVATQPRHTCTKRHHQWGRGSAEQLWGAGEPVV